MNPAEKTSELPAISVSAALTMPPVQLSATASLRPTARLLAKTLAASSSRATRRDSASVSTGSILRKLQGCRRPRCDPFAAAGKAQPLGRCGLHTNPFERNRKDFGNARPHRGAVRADLRGLGDNGQVDMIDAAAARRHALGRESEEAVRSGAAPLRIARRKMIANIAVGERARS